MSTSPTSFLPHGTGLVFREVQVTEAGSLALLFEGIAERCGIYWIDFDDGASYVGQSVTARSRLATHRRRWSDAGTVRFAECGRDELDRREQQVISWVEKQRPLRNKILTQRPGGDVDLFVEITPGATLTLPWERARRNESTPAAEGWAAPPKVPTAKQTTQFSELKNRADYPHIVRSIGALLSACVPSPRATEEVLWTVSAVPATSVSRDQRRLVTLNVGRLEVLRIHETRSATPSVFAVINMPPDVDQWEMKGALSRAGCSPSAIGRADYSQQTTVTAITFDSLDALATALDVEPVQDEIYRLAVGLMRQGINPLRRFHNPLLGRAALDTDGF